ncbi:hypothetical protein OBBRIDRAFT_768719 [Obba rivulosa]|uniref:Uncharacterized protein n=1 Tax=Obba rivulosa TaxID=1052685 RepID=A0A8E2DSD9_9APHY|nr:hypothetical protein OBBRIDRAFT_768719 [Obba rivulosa]
MQGGEFGTALQAASSNGHLKVAHFLTDHGAIHTKAENTEDLSETVMQPT